MKLQTVQTKKFTLFLSECQISLNSKTLLALSLSHDFFLLDCLSLPTLTLSLSHSFFTLNCLSHLAFSLKGKLWIK